MALGPKAPKIEAWPRECAPSGRRTTSPNSNGAVSRLLAITQEHETMCAQLVAGARQFEEQLRALRAQQEALQTEAQAIRRCLDKAGLLPTDVLEKELQQFREGGDIRHAQSGANNSATGAADPNQAHGAAAVGVPYSAVHNVSGSGGPSSVCSAGADSDTLHPQALSPSNPPALTRGRSQAASPSTASQQLDTSCHHVVARGRSSPVTARSSPVANRCRSASVHAAGRDGGVNQGSSPLLQRSLSANRLPIAGEVSDSLRRQENPEETVDLYPLMQQLVDRSGSAADQQRAVRAVQRILKSSVDLNTKWSGRGTPLAAAVKAGRCDLARMLLRARANPNERDQKGVSPLHISTFEGNIDLCRVLLMARADVDACDRHGQTPLFFAPTREVCKCLIERRADVTILNRKGQSALHLAGRAGLFEVFTWLTSRVSKALVELKDVHGYTAGVYAQRATSHPPSEASTHSLPGGPDVPGLNTGTDASLDAESPNSWAGGQGSASEHIEETGSAVPLPSVSELVEEYHARQGDARPAQQAYDGIKEACSNETQRAVLEAAAAVATAAVATAAELEVAITPRRCNSNNNNNNNRNARSGDQASLSPRHRNKNTNGSQNAPGGQQLDQVS